MIIPPDFYGRNGPVWDAKAPIVPVDDAGNWLHYPENFYMRRGGGWEKVIPFPAELRIDSLQSGRSAKYVILRDQRNGKTYPMFISDLLKYLESATVVQGLLTGVWTASKRGQNYGIKVHK